MRSLDGMRGLAILLVVWHNGATTGHWATDGLFAKFVLLTAAMGWMGVQLFFVLSGFLITGILLNEKGTPHQFRNFYARRALRIFPLYYLILIAVIYVLPQLGSKPAEMSNVSGGMWYWFFLENWVIPFYGGGGGLSHFWSLAVEEQFYLVWPFAIIFLARRPLVFICFALIATALIFRVVLIAYYPEIAKWAAYEFTIVRWDALAIGALLAFAVRDEACTRRLDGVANKVAAVLLLYVLVYIVLFHNFAAVETVLSAFNQTIVAILAAVMLFRGIQAGRSDSAGLPRLLHSRALGDIGKYSYAIYIFHFPVILTINPLWADCCSTLQQGSPVISTVLRIAAAAVVSYLLARVSWLFVEAPALRLRTYFMPSGSRTLSGNHAQSS